MCTRCLCLGACVRVVCACCNAQVMLANKLDGDGSLRFVAAALPLALALLVLCLLACLSPVSRLTAGLGFAPAGGAYGGARSSPRREHWWFGVRDDWGSFFFDCLPLLRLYGILLLFCSLMYFCGYKCFRSAQHSTRSAEALIHSFFTQQSLHSVTAPSPPTARATGNPIYTIQDLV